GKKRFNQILKRVREELEARVAEGWRPGPIGLVSELEDADPGDELQQDAIPGQSPARSDGQSGSPGARPLTDERSPWRERDESPWLDASTPEGSAAKQRAATPTPMPTRGSLGSPVRPSGQALEDRRPERGDGSYVDLPARSGAAAKLDRDGSSFVRRAGRQRSEGSEAGSASGSADGNALFRAGPEARRSPDFSAHLPRGPSRPREIGAPEGPRDDDDSSAFSEAGLRRGARPQA